MKKAISLMLAFVLCLSLCSCGNDPVSKIKDVCKEYNLSNLEVSYKESWSLRENTFYKIDVNCDGASVLDKEQMGLLLDSIQSAGTDWDSNRYVSQEDVTINSDGHVYTYVKDNNDKYVLTVDGETFLSEEAMVELEKLDELKQTIFASSDPTAFADYLKLFRTVAEYGRNLNTIEYFPYDEVLNFISNNWEVVTTENTDTSFYYGYISERDESYWYDPLSNTKESKGEVGFYRYTFQSTCYGDLKTEYETRYWYQTDRNDSNNRYDGKLFYKDYLVSSDYTDINGFAQYLSDNKVYGCVDKSGDVTLIVILDDAFMVQQDRLFFIYYS